MPHRPTTATPASEGVVALGARAFPSRADRTRDVRSAAPTPPKRGRVYRIGGYRWKIGTATEQCAAPGVMALAAPLFFRY